MTPSSPLGCVFLLTLNCEEQKSQAAVRMHDEVCDLRSQQRLLDVIQLAADGVADLPFHGQSTLDAKGGALCIRIQQVPCKL